MAKDSTARRPRDVAGAGGIRPRDVGDDEAFGRIGISDDLMFKDVFGGDPVLAGMLLSCALGEDVGEVEYVNASEEVRPERGARGTTCDVYLRTREGALGNLEMQRSRKGELPLRLRTHLANIDREAIRSGERFTEARRSVAVFVCTFDPFSQGLRRYTVQRMIRETGERFPDRQEGLFLYSGGGGDDVPGDLALFLRYVDGYHDSETMASELVRLADERVRANRGDWEWRRGYMTLQEKLDDARAEGVERGIEIGELKAYAGLVADGVLTVEEASARLGMTADELRSAMDRGPATGA